MHLCATLVNIASASLLFVDEFKVIRSFSKFILASSSARTTPASDSTASELIYYTSTPFFCVQCLCYQLIFVNKHLHNIAKAVLNKDTVTT